MTCGEAVQAATAPLQHLTGALSQHINSLIEECCVKNKSEKSMFPLLCLTGELRERDGDTERRQRRKTRHIDLNGFSPYITVRSTLQPPLEREHVVNISSSGKSMQSESTLIG